MRLLGSKILVDRNAPAAVRFDASRRQVQLVDIALPADRIEQRVARHLLLAFEIRDHAAVGQLLHALHFFAQAHGHAGVAQVIAERLDDLLVGELQQPRPLFNQRDAHAERREHAGVLDADHAAAHHDQGLGQVGQVQNLVAVDDGAGR